eukprot:1256363-Ditylum_brightwellii.AAC.1
MKTTSAQPTESFYIKDPPGINNMVGRISGDRYKAILEAKYEKSDLKKEVDNNCPQLSLKQLAICPTYLPLQRVLGPCRTYIDHGWA